MTAADMNWECALCRAKFSYDQSASRKAMLLTWRYCTLYLARYGAIQAVLLRTEDVLGKGKGKVHTRTGHEDPKGK
jgi:hypothetical protein